MPIKLIVAGIILIVIAIIDTASLKIPDSLLGILLIFSIGYDFAFDHTRIIYGAVSFLAFFLIFGGIYYFYGGLGFGDVKLVACISNTIGFMSTVFVCLIASLLGIIFLVFLLNIETVKQSKIPFAPFLTLAYCVLIVVRSIIL